MRARNPEEGAWNVSALRAVCVCGCPGVFAETCGGELSDASPGGFIRSITMRTKYSVLVKARGRAVGCHWTKTLRAGLRHGSRAEGEERG